ncbi:alpha-amylase family protein [Cohnella rhizosphaerae]|uniref:Uncharacterized protein n=1 Tax=Cohnella rhizosphaerae TaxID=1457232 RepID=A0A9X4KTW0_9BACL|nr:hypothetical protein [Cohnella rhizosphaerae]MDG0808147.1 hypothetical protein [Cohnella rhizosphaerae]
MEQANVVLLAEDGAKLTVRARDYEARFDLDAQRWRLYGRKEEAVSRADGGNGGLEPIASQPIVSQKIASQPIASLPIQSRVHALGDPDRADAGTLRLVREQRDGSRLTLAFAAGRGMPWSTKTYIFTFDADTVRYSVSVTGAGRRIDDVYYFAADWQAAGDSGNEASTPDWQGGRPGFERYYAPRFDWAVGIVHRMPDEQDSLNCQQWLSPPPFCYALQQSDRWVSCGIVAAPGAFNFLGFDYAVSPGGDFSFRLDYEGHTTVGKAGFRTPELRFGFKPAAGENEAVDEYVRALAGVLKPEEGTAPAAVRPQPAWWREPMFCGWGQQRYDYRMDHDGTESGHFLNVGAYATEDKYRSYIALMDEQGIRPGTIVIDYKWAKQDALAAPDPLKWNDMRAFIEEQHEIGRRVLLWYSPFAGRRAARRGLHDAGRPRRSRRSDIGAIPGHYGGAGPQDDRQCAGRSERRRLQDRLYAKCRFRAKNLPQLLVDQPGAAQRRQSRACLSPARLRPRQAHSYGGQLVGRRIAARLY